MLRQCLAKGLKLQANFDPASSASGVLHTEITGVHGHTQPQENAYKITVYSLIE